MWFDDATIYQIYPLGLCGAPLQNDGSDQTGEHRILRVLDWVEHIKKLGATCVLFNPLFDSDAHGYDTRDFRHVDCRLGTNEDFAAVCKTLHEHGIRVVLAPPELVQEFAAEGTPMLLALLALGNLSFWLCDRALTAITPLYRQRIAPRLKKKF